jgi:hypothetical protein
VGIRSLHSGFQILRALLGYERRPAFRTLHGVKVDSPDLIGRDRIAACGTARVERGENFLQVDLPAGRHARKDSSTLGRRQGECQSAVIPNRFTARLSTEWERPIQGRLPLGGSTLAAIARRSAS